MLQNEKKSNMEKEIEDQLLCVEVEENIRITLIDPPSKSESMKENMNCNKDERLYVKYSPLLRRTHAKALSVGDTTDDNDFPKSFSQNRELWQQRASSHTSVNSIGLSTKEMRDFRQKHTPDLVMDLPVQEAVKSPEETESETASEPESPDMALAAERFAKQNQCTLKKNTRDVRHRNEKTEKNGTGAKGNVDDSPRLSPVNKPQIKAKPQILRKPIMTPSPTLPLHMIRKEHMEQE